MYYYGARYYDPLLGRFTSVDPWDGDMTDPQSLNKYAYVRNNPMKYVDPTGMFNVNTGEVEGGDTMTSIVKEINGYYRTDLSMGKIAEVSGIKDVNTINVGDHIVVPKEDMELIFDNEYLQAHDKNYDILYEDLKWKAVSGIKGLYDSIPEGIWKIDPKNTEYFKNLTYAQAFYSQFRRGLWPGGLSSWGSVRTELDNLDTKEKNTGYYIHGGSYPGSKGCIDLTSENENFHAWLKYKWGKAINIIVNYDNTR